MSSIENDTWHAGADVEKFENSHYQNCSVFMDIDIGEIF